MRNIPQLNSREFFPQKRRMIMELILSNNVKEIEAFVEAGFCPIECSIDGKSIVDELQMDHHGELSNLESVAVRAYRDHFGARSNDPRYICTGVPDADACFAVASLTGIIPHPDRKVSEKLPPHIRESLTRDLTDLAETIARVDVNPIGLNIPEMEGGSLLLTWNAMNNGRDSLAFQAGVGLWRSLLEANPAQIHPFLKASKEAEKNRIKASLEDLERGSLVAAGVLLIEGSRTFGFPEWYGRRQDFNFDHPTGWKHPVVLAHLERGRNITIGCPNQEVAEALFGPGGLKNVFSKLQPEGWGGREAIGGSPRGEEISTEEAQAAAETVAKAIIC
jgi:hypothetical protein